VKRAVAAVCSAALCGCSLLQTIAQGHEPSLSFKGASLSDVTLAGATVNLTFTVQNPNPVGISLADADYKLSLAGKQLVAGKPPARLRIPASGSSDVTLPAQVRFADLGESIAAVLQRNEVPYQAEGHIGVSTGIGVIPLAFSKQGTLPLPRIPDVTLESPRIASISLTQATLDLPLLLSNPNPFPLPLGSMVGDLRIAGAQVGRIASADLGRIDARQSRTVAIPVTVHFAQAFSAAQALREGKARVALDAQLSSGGASVPVRVERDVDFTR
jgi:LEA14-like dessication related protein